MPLRGDGNSQALLSTDTDYSALESLKHDESVVTVPGSSQLQTTDVELDGEVRGDAVCRCGSPDCFVPRGSVADRWYRTGRMSRKCAGCWRRMIEFSEQCPDTTVDLEEEVVVCRQCGHCVELYLNCTDEEIWQRHAATLLHVRAVFDRIQRRRFLRPKSMAKRSVSPAPESRGPKRRP